MTKRKSKKPQEDTSILLEPQMSQATSKTNSNTSSSVWLFIVVFTAGASVMGWCCAQQQQSLHQLSETFTTMQKRVATLQRVVETSGAQTDSGVGVEKRMFALEEAQKQARETAEFALATSEKLRNFDELWALQDEMDSRLTDIKQVVLSVTTLQAMFGNHSEELEAVKESVAAALSSGSALAENVAGLAGAVLGASARVDEQVASAEALNAQLDGQASDLSELRESMDLHKDVLHTNNQEMAAIKALIEAKQAMRAQALEEMLSSVQMTLDEQYFTSQTLRSSLMTRLQTFHSQLANASSMEAKSNEEGPAAEEFIATAAQNAAEVTEVKMEEVEEKDEQQETDDEGEEEEEVMQEEKPLQQEVERGVVEEQGEEEEEMTPEEGEEMTPEEEEEEEITPQKEEEITPQNEEDEDNTVGAGEEEAAEDTVDAHVLDTSLEEEVPKEVGDTVVEDSGEFNGEVFTDGDGEVV